MKLIFQLIVGLLLIKRNFSQLNPLKDAHVCGLPRCDGTGKFKYGPGIQQNYKYSVEITTQFNGTSKNESTLYVEGTASFSFISPCDGILSLSDIELYENSPSKDPKSKQHPNSLDFAASISDYSLRFAFRDGVITELCPAEDEKSWVLNMKRGILSMFHNTMKRFDLDHVNEEEEDIRGKCTTYYRVVGAKETTLLIEKTKDLNTCQRRSKFNSILQSTTIPNFEPTRRNDKILNSTSHCEISIDHNIYKDISCKETYLLQPFSNENSGVTTTVLQKLNLFSEEPTETTPDEISERTILGFDHTLPTKITHGELKTSRDLIKTLCNRNKNELHVDYSDIFSKLIQSLRLLSYPALSALFGHAKTTCSTGRKHLMDVLPFVNTAASVAIIRDIILKENVPESTVNEWTISMALIGNPDEDMMEAAASLLQQYKFTPTLTLSVASLTHSYCIHHSDCQKTKGVSIIIQHFEDDFLGLLGKHGLERQIYDKMMVTLKAISNIGLMSETFKDELFKIIEDDNIDVGLRVAAIESFRRAPCDETRNYFERIFRDQYEDAEVRIASYLQIMKCPNYLLIRTIRHTLKEEEVNQVGSFVWTHLKNLLKTSVPSKVEIQSLLSEKDLVKKFSSDVRKFSHNFEGSMYFDDYNLGSSYESNVIFSTSSYIPRSVTFNLTVDMFGESVNLFEVYGRLEGLEHYVESLFGPKGSSRAMADSIINKIRPARSVRGDEILKNEIDKLPNVLNNITKTPNVLFGLKLFGNNLKYTSFRGEDEILSAVDNLNPLNQLKRIFSGKEISYNKAVMFLDCNYVIPTGAGFPLMLTALGTSSVNTKLYGSLKSGGFSQGKELDLDLSADIQPSVSIDITGEMLVDAFYASTGAKLRTSMYTDTAVEATVKIRGTKLLSVKFSLPRQKNEIFGARSELLLRTHNGEELQSGVSKNTESNLICSLPTIEKTVGLKLCAEYNFVNVTSMKNIPHILISGPAAFRCYINKSDPTANIYLFEYKWTQRRDLSTISLIFDTPGSEISRVFNANFTIDRQSQNLTMLLQSSAGTILARGKYMNRENEKYIQVVLDIDNKKHFDASMSLTTSEIRNGFSYRPTLYVGVNGERVLKLHGSVDLISKRGISQYTVDLKFETKRLNSKLFGYISKSESSLEVNLYQDYKFHQTREQRIVLKFRIANRSRKNIVSIVGFCNLNSTAYPNLNFASNATFQRSGSHMDLVVTLNQSPLFNHPDAELQTLKFKMLLSYKCFTENKRTFRVAAAVSRRSSDLDLEGEFLYESFRYDVNMAAHVKYGDNKKVAVTVFWSHPRSTLEQFKTYINITVPSFTPMILKLEVDEKHPKDYMIDVNATWFSGHTLTALGFYQDKSTSSSSNHHFKLLLNSPSFKEANANLQYFRDNNNFKLDFMVSHNDNNYQLFFNNQVISPEETTTEGKILYKEKLYRFVGTVHDGNHKEIRAELHLDQIRDIVFTLLLANMENHKSFDFMINWDANRDPNQKLLISTNYTKVAEMNYIANFIFSYPSHTIIGDYRFSFNRGNINTLASLSWDGGKTFALDLNILYGNQQKLFLDFFSTLRTPFDNWRLVKLNGQFEHLINKYSLNGIMTWDRGQKVAVDIFGDYLTSGSIFTCKYSFSIGSSLSHIPNVNVTLSHAQNDTNFNSILHLMYNPEFVIDLDSQWKIESLGDSTNLTGTVLSHTPFKGLNKGFLVSKIFLKNSNSIKGVAHIDLDNKPMTVNLEGKFKKLTNCMLTINLTSSAEDYQLRFKISTEEHHLVALFTYPTGNLGTEVLLSFNTLTNFHIKLYLATPIEFLQKIIILGKLKPNEVDFRLGWNFLLIGFSGIWNYVNITNFEYSYKIYTPIQDFEENGIVAKLIIKEGLDSEASVKLSNYKLGIKLLGQSKPKLPKDLNLEVKNIYSKMTQGEKLNYDPLSWKGLFELDIIIYPTMKGELEIDQKGYSYIVQSKLTTPQGLATLYDEFEYIDILSIKNDMTIITPYQSFKTITSNFNINVETGRLYVFSLDMYYKNGTNLIQTGIYAKYSNETVDDKKRIYNASLKVNTPLKAFPMVSIFGIFEAEPSLYHTVLQFATNRSDISVNASTKINGGFMELTSLFNVRTPSIIIPPCHLNLTKQFNPTNNFITLNLNMPEKLKKDIYFKTSWLVRSQREFRALVQLNTPFSGLENTRASLDVYSSTEISTLHVEIQMNPLDAKIDSTLKNNVFTSTSLLNFNRKSYPISVNCTILKPTPDTRQFDGTLIVKDKVFEISGDAYILTNIPMRASIKLNPVDKSTPFYFEYEIKPVSTHKHKILGKIQNFNKPTNFNGFLDIQDKFNWVFNIEIDPHSPSQITVQTNAFSDKNSKNLLIEANTSIPNLEHPKLGAEYTFSKPQHILHGFFEVTQAKGSIDINLIWIFLENMYANINGKFNNINYSTQSSLEAFYKNPQKIFHLLDAGGDVKIGNNFEAGTNVSLKLQDNIGIEGHFKTPDVNKEIYSVYGHFDYAKNLRDIDCSLKYRTAYSLQKYGICGKILTQDVKNLSGNVEVEWNSQKYNNLATFKGPLNMFDLVYKLKTPKFTNQQFIVTEVNFKSLDGYHNLTGEVFHPENRSIAFAAVDYKELGNMNGTLNTTLPYKSINYAGANYNTVTNEVQYNRYIKVFWDKNNAILDSVCDVKIQAAPFERNTKGMLTIEVPLTTRHITLVDYEYKETAKISKGSAVVKLNGTDVLNCIYRNLTESGSGWNKDKIHVELKNKFMPIGADYVHKQEYNSIKDKRNANNLDSKYVHLYNLQNQSKFNLTGELHIRTRWSGQEYIVKATHGNRTVKLWNDFDILDKIYKQHSRLELSPTHWIEYDLKLFNDTVDETFDAQHVVLNVFYPRRNFTANGFYNISDTDVLSNVSLEWDKEQKTIQVELNWKRLAYHRERLLMQIKHPSFEKDVSLITEYGYNRTVIDGQLLLDYSSNPGQLLTFSGNLMDNSNYKGYNYSYTIFAEHGATSLNLLSRGDVYWNSSSIGTEHVTTYQRSYLPLTTSQSLARINIAEREIEMKKDNVASEQSYFYGRYGGEFPIYTANMSLIHETNHSDGEFLIDLRDKLVYANVNLTEDGSQSLHVYGSIPDVRSAVFDIWQDYEDKRVSHVSYFIQMNHSRLITSKLFWRPELIGEVQRGIRGSVAQVYLYTLDSINNTKQYIRTETSDAINGIWLDVKPNIHMFLSDLRNLSVIENDIYEFKQFLNKSYYANEFYIKDISTAVMGMFDELALKSHLQSLPTIVQEIKSVMGDSGEKIKKGILWVIEKINTYYKNTTDFIHGFINGDPVEHVTKLFENVIEKYDEFIKNLHVTVIQYMEGLWSQTYALFMENWHRTLAAIEPTFLKLIHYLESIVWNTGKEFLDFLYLRKNEIIESPYFIRLTKFTHDIDKFYKDITGKNTIASIYKYINIAWNFLKEKYINSIPFGKELSAILSEILDELKQVGNIPSVKYFTGKVKEMYRYGKYYYDVFDVENRLHRIISLIYIKISDMSITALEVENRQRVAKTKFIFEPNDGIIIMEQKLPMPWHAFNETPKFKEIPEIKYIYDLQNYLEASKLSFWDLYYDYQPLMNLAEWLPPFKGQAMLAGSTNYVTFDRTYYSFHGSCTYVLAADFVDSNFTLLVSHGDSEKNSELIVLLDKTIIHINLFTKKIQIGGLGLHRLPLQIGDTYLYQNADLLIIEKSSEFILECNLKFQICTFQVSGWYFGKIAGLWGTYNNEPSDDLLPFPKIHSNTSNLQTFTDGWSLDKKCKTSAPNTKKSSEIVPQNIAALCKDFFSSTVSQLSTCFGRIPSKNFLSMCLNSTTEHEACMSAISYINLCGYANVPLRIPDACVKCKLLNGTEIKEGDLIRVQGDTIPQTVDVVFIIEAKKCNRDLRKSKNFENVVEQLEKELTALNLTENRYAVVIFGGDGVYDEPRSVISDGNVFTDSKSIVNYLNNLPIGNGNKDIFNAIIFAYNLMFRPGVSKTFIVLPCSECNKFNMLHDYSTVHQLLSDEAISLHIIMKEQFTMQKEREAKVVLGIDRKLAYSKRDVRTLVGDQLLRKSIVLPKPTLGLCLSLTMETNGTVFSGKYLESDKKTAKQFSTVFSKIVARKSLPRPCVECECTAPNSGISYMECYQCTTMNLSRHAIEHQILGFEDEDTLGNMNILESFNF